MKKDKSRRFLRIAQKAKALHHEIVSLESEWDGLKKPAQRFEPTSLDEEIEAAAFAMESLSRNAFFYAREDAK